MYPLSGPAFFLHLHFLPLCLLWILLQGLHPVVCTFYNNIAGEASVLSGFSLKAQIPWTPLLAEAGMRFPGTEEPPLSDLVPGFLL